MKNLRKTLKEGQKVWSLRFGSGRVVRLRLPYEENIWTISVEFRTRERDGFQRWYNDKGQINIQERRDLYASKPVITSKKRLNTIIKRKSGHILVMPMDMVKNLRVVDNPVLGPDADFSFNMKMPNINEEERRRLIEGNWNAAADAERKEILNKSWGCRSITDDDKRRHIVSRAYKFNCVLERYYDTLTGWIDNDLMSYLSIGIGFNMEDLETKGNGQYWRPRCLRILDSEAFDLVGPDYDPNNSNGNE